MVLIGLSLAIFLHSKTLSCDKCEVKFKATKDLGIQTINNEVSVNMQDLSNNLSISKCLVQWDDVSGYYFNKH